MNRMLIVCLLVLLPVLFGDWGNQANAQPFGVELHNTVMPASGGMGGASVAQPQDLASSINGNPATLTQFRGTQFMFGGAWIEPTFNLRHDGSAGLPHLGTFQAKSDDQGFGVANFGVTRDLSSLGLPATIGLGFITEAGGAVGFRDVPESSGFDNFLVVFEMQAAAGVDLTERLSAGARLSLGAGIFEGPFLGVTTSTYDYALRGTIGINYEFNACTNVGFYWQTRQSFTFKDAVRLDLGSSLDIFRDINLDLPGNIGFGVANNSLMGGDLLVAADVLYKQWDSADLFDALYDDQWAFQVGSQLTRGRLRYRIGYVYAENPIDPSPGISVGGITPPGAVNAIQFVQSGLAVINQHRLSAGVGIRDLLPGIDLDIAAGGMPKASDNLGQFTAVNLETYWISLGLTFRCGRGACGDRGTRY